MTDQPILIIGGGPAGAACAIQLAARGIAVEIVERAAFPRTKVCGCCLGGSGIQTLAELGLKEWALAKGERIDSWRGCIDSREVRLPLPAGIAISREALDTKLLSFAEQHGVLVRHECTARIESRESVHGQPVTVSLNGISKSYQCIVLAVGLNGVGQSILPWTEVPNGPFGLSFTVDPSPHIQRGTIYMVCDSDGYVGLVQLESGRVDIAAALRSGAQAAKHASPFQRVRRMLAASPLSALDFLGATKLMTTPPLRRSRVAGAGRFMAIGDSAGYVEPFTGEGMTWAMKSGIAAADFISQQYDALQHIGDQWAPLAANLLRSRKRTCRAITSALGWTPTRRLIGLGLFAAPALAKPLVARLNS